MAQKPETKFRARIRPLLESIPKSYWESVQQKTIRGTPDILGCVNGYFVALELKVDSEVTVLQRHKLECIKYANGIALVVTPKNWEEVFTGLKALSVCLNEGALDVTSN